MGVVSASGPPLAQARMVRSEPVGHGTCCPRSQAVTQKSWRGKDSVSLDTLAHFWEMRRVRVLA